MSDSSTDVGCYNEGESDDDSVISEREEFPLPWDNWETFVAELVSPACHHQCPVLRHKKGPCLPRRTSDNAHGHHDKLGTSPYPDNLWDEDQPREWDDVRVEARRGGGCTVHLGYLFSVYASRRIPSLPNT